MLELLSLLDRSYRTITEQLEAWFDSFPKDVAWYVVSDYCIGDERKVNDTFAFSIIANHDKFKNIAEYITAVAPSDIKARRTASQGLISYLRCPVTFSVTYVVDRQSKLLRDYITNENMVAFLPEARGILGTWQANSPVDSGYYKAVQDRFVKFERAMQRSTFNSKLARGVFLVAAFAAMVFKHLNAAKTPSHIKWISDRDSMFDQYDAVAYDLGFVFFLLEYSRNLSSAFVMEKPNFIFELADKTGTHRFDELIRLPDCLAGTLADMDFNTRKFTHPKFGELFEGIFVGSTNNAIVQVLGEGEHLITRRIASPAA
jgi:hypothetical protein